MPKNDIFKLVFLAFIFELAVFHQLWPLPVILAVTFGVWDFLRANVSFERKFILASLPVLAISVLSWTTILVGQIFILAMLFLYFWVQGYLERIVKSDKTSEWIEAGLWLYIFLLALNFFVSRNDIFEFVGIPFIATAFLMFAAIYLKHPNYFEAMIFTLLAAEIMLVGALLPSSYLVLAAVLTTALAVSSARLKQWKAGNTVFDRKDMIRIGGLALLLAVLVISSGVQPK